MNTTATKVAFDRFREQYGPEWGPRINCHPSECNPLGRDDGLTELVDGAGASDDAPARLQPVNALDLPAPIKLWVVREADVVHADEICAFGAGLPDGKIKHSNLTGGEPAFSGGEFVTLNEGTLIVGGNSGRYGPRSANEMRDVAIAFRDAGYTVYSTGYDQEANRALPLVGPAPKLI